MLRRLDRLATLVAIRSHQSNAFLKKFLLHIEAARLDYAFNNPRAEM